MIRPLVLAETRDNQITPASLAAIGAAQFWSDQLVVVVLATSLDQNQLQRLSAISSVTQILTLAPCEVQYSSMQWQAAQLAPFVADFDVILAAATTLSKGIIPTLATMYDCNAYSDVIDIIDNHRLLRPVYAGHLQQTVISQDTKLFLTVRGSAFQPPETIGGLDAVVKTLPMQIPQQPIGSIDKRCDNASLRPRLEDASRVVVGGRGLRDPQGFAMAFELADCIGAAVGATRAAVDAGMISNDYQVGQTGKVIAPALYIALGVSGAVQHLAGIKDSGVIVAVNHDADAPIFAVADYGLVGDVFDVVPELIKQLGLSQSMKEK